jgi:hypothetical protein
VVHSIWLRHSLNSNSTRLFSIHLLRGSIGCAKVDLAVVNDNGFGSRAVQRFLPTFLE